MSKLPGRRLPRNKSGAGDSCVNRGAGRNRCFQAGVSLPSGKEAAVHSMVWTIALVMIAGALANGEAAGETCRVKPESVLAQTQKLLGEVRAYRLVQEDPAQVLEAAFFVKLETAVGNLRLLVETCPGHPLAQRLARGRRVGGFFLDETQRFLDRERQRLGVVFVDCLASERWDLDGPVCRDVVRHLVFRYVRKHGLVGAAEMASSLAEPGPRTRARRDLASLWLQRRDLEQALVVEDLTQRASLLRRIEAGAGLAADADLARQVRVSLAGLRLRCQATGEVPDTQLPERARLLAAGSAEEKRTAYAAAVRDRLWTGDCAGALALADEVAEAGLRNRLLAAVARGYAAAGEVALALEVVERVQDAGSYDNALAGVLRSRLREAGLPGIVPLGDLFRDERRKFRWGVFRRSLQQE